MMTKLQVFLRDSIVFVEFFCALIALFKYNSLKNTYWKWFVYYVVMIFIFELFSFTVLDYFPNVRKYYFSFLVIPFQFFFFYWLYALKSFNSVKIFIIVALVYGVTFSVTHFTGVDKTRIINMISYSVGGMLLFFLVLLEFLKQIKSDEILNFSQNKMFYINFGVALFYVGTLPFYAFDGFAVEHAKEIWRNYWTTSLFFNNILYLLFTASFIWGKPLT